MYSTEKIFITKFIACLKRMGVNQIPYDDDDFYNGAEKMKEYFQAYRHELGEHSNELSMLFLQHPLTGTFPEFKYGIEQENGSLMTFENPHYVRANIQLDERGVEFILGKKNLDIANNHLYNFSKAFCSGARIKYNEV